MEITEEQKQMIRDQVKLANNAISNIEDIVFQKNNPLWKKKFASDYAAAHLSKLARMLFDLKKEVHPLT